MNLEELAVRMNHDYDAEYVWRSEAFDGEVVLIPTAKGNLLVVGQFNESLRVDIMGEDGISLIGSIFLSNDIDQAVYSLKNLVPLV